jgi:hypothetical protein
MTERKELIASLREVHRGHTDEGPSTFSEAASMLEADAPAVPQEPVAYLAWRDGKPCWEGDDCVCADAVYPVDHDDDRTSMPVYLAPQQRPRLTDAEIKAIEHETDMKSSIGDWSNCFARAIEAKVRGEG